ncbi:hypothetical protein HK098_000690 [Nowakowskiella sp. JEL0407]|nr:hypothetical protein HK098_000690 [Nowakowskiella sp. JEL0407]
MVFVLSIIAIVILIPSTLQQSPNIPLVNPFYTSCTANANCTIYQTSLRASCSSAPSPKIGIPCVCDIFNSFEAKGCFSCVLKINKQVGQTELDSMMKVCESVKAQGPNLTPETGNSFLTSAVTFAKALNWDFGNGLVSALAQVNSTTIMIDKENIPITANSPTSVPSTYPVGSTSWAAIITWNAWINLIIFLCFILNGF